MRKLIALIIALILPAIAIGQLEVEQPFQDSMWEFFADSADALWEASDDTLLYTKVSRRFTGNEIHGAFKLDSLESASGDGDVLVGWSLKYRRHFDNSEADSLMESDGSVHGYRFVDIVNTDIADADFDALTIIPGAWYEFKADLDGLRPYCIEWYLENSFFWQVGDCLRVNLRIDGFAN